MVSSVSSKYLNYNSHRVGEIGDGISTINGDNIQANKIGNFNDYQHVYNDHQSNGANVQWITKLRESDSKNSLF